MSKSLLILLIACFAPATLAQSTTEDGRRIEVFAGYSQNRIKAQTLDENNSPTIKRLGLNGFNLEVTSKISKLFGITGDLSGHYRSDTFNGFGGVSQKSKLQLYNFLGGPQVKAPNSRRFTPFAHALFGLAHLSNSISGGSNSTDSHTNFAMAFGGGLDVGVSKRVAVRIFQADYNPTFFADSRQDNIRFSFGIVFK